MRKLMALPFILLLAACVAFPGPRAADLALQGSPSTSTSAAEQSVAPTESSPTPSIATAAPLVEPTAEITEMRRRADYSYMVMTSVQANIAAFETLAINIRDEKINPPTATIYRNFVRGVMQNSTDFLTMTPEDSNLLPLWEQAREYNQLAVSLFEAWADGKASDGEAISQTNSILANFDNTMKNAEAVIQMEFGSTPADLIRSRTWALQSFRAAMSDNAVALVDNRIPDLR